MIKYVFSSCHQALFTCTSEKYDIRIILKNISSTVWVIIGVRNRETARNAIVENEYVNLFLSLNISLSLSPSLSVSKLCSSEFAIRKSQKLLLLQNGMFGEIFLISSTYSIKPATFKRDIYVMYASIFTLSYFCS